MQESFSPCPMLLWTCSQHWVSLGVAPGVAVPVSGYEGTEFPRSSLGASTVAKSNLPPPGASFRDPQTSSEISQPQHLTL